jgi:hypothetical protein
MGIRMKQEEEMGSNMPSNVQILEMAGSDDAAFFAALIIAFELSTPWILPVP